MVKKKRWTKHEKVFFVLLIIVIFLATLNVGKDRGWFIPLQAWSSSGNLIDLDSLTLEQKVAQMVIAQGDRSFRDVWRKIQLGGIHLFALSSEHVYNNTILDYQYQMPIPFFVTADLEGCVSPFTHIQNFTPASEIKDVGQAFEKGFRDGAFLKKLGFNLNFAPVVDLDDAIWKCRNFPGDEIKIAEMAQAYTLGLQNNGIIATAKHYPGKTLVVRDPHKFLVTADIESKDVFPYRYLSDKGNIKAIMVSHIITTGEVDSEGIPSVVSPKVYADIRKEFDGLIISDEIHMLGLKSFYENLDDMYIAVFKAGNDIVLNFDRDPNEVYRMIKVIADAVRRGEIEEDQIDASVTRILEAKGFRVV